MVPEDTATSWWPTDTRLPTAHLTDTRLPTAHLTDTSLPTAHLTDTSRDLRQPQQQQSGGNKSGEPREERAKRTQQPSVEESLVRQFVCQCRGGSQERLLKQLSKISLPEPQILPECPWNPENLGTRAVPSVKIQPAKSS